jgi:hypothetical protein
MSTVFSRNASASALHPAGPMLFHPRSSVMSIYERKLNMSRRDIKEKKMFTLFSRKASASAFAPSLPMVFHPRSSVVSVYERTAKMSKIDIRRKRCLPCFLGKHQPVRWLLYSRYHYFGD